MTDKKQVFNNQAITTAIATIIRYVIVPVLLWWASNSLNTFSTELKDLRQMVGEQGRKLDTFQATSDAYKEVIRKELDFLNYRLTLLENRYGDYGQVHSKLLGERSSGTTTNVNPLGESPDK